MTQNANIVITNNMLDHGIYSSGVGPSTYTYDHCMWVYGSALIEGNTLSNPAPSADMINTTDGYFTIRNNSLFRNAVSINTYIRHHTTVAIPPIGISQITDNIFDNFTVDGTSEELVSGLNLGSVYTKNKNQTGFIYIPLFDNTTGTRTLVGDGIPYLGGTSFPALPNHYTYKTGVNLITRIDPGSASVGSPNWGELFVMNKSFHIGAYLEKGMEVLGLRIGGYRSAGTLTNFSPPYSYFDVRLKSHLGTDNMDAKQYATFPSFNRLSYWYQFVIDTAPKFSNLSVDTQYTDTAPYVYEFPPDEPSVAPPLLRAGMGYNMEVEFTAFITFDNASWSMFFSPIEVKYRW